MLDTGPGRNGKTNPDGVPDLTRNPGIQLNERVSLRQLFELLKFSQSCGLARRSCTLAKPCVPRDQGSPLREGAAAPPMNATEPARAGRSEMSGLAGFFLTTIEQWRAVPELTRSACIQLNE